MRKQSKQYTKKSNCTEDHERNIFTDLHNNFMKFKIKINAGSKSF